MVASLERPLAAQLSFAVLIVSIPELQPEPGFPLITAESVEIDDVRAWLAQILPEAKAG